MKKELKNLKKDIRDGLVKFMSEKVPGKSLSTYKTFASDSNYLINNGYEDEYLRFMRSEDNMPEIQTLIRRVLVEHRGEDKVKNGDVYYYEKLSWQREYIRSIGGIDKLIGKY